MAEANGTPFHEAANIFPLDDDNIDSLAADIKANGLQVPVEICDGKIIDGRRRSMACRLVGVKPVTKQVSPDDPVAYVLSLNLHRRHLTPSQKSMVAARARDRYDKQAKERMTKGTKSDPMENLPQGSARDAAGKAVGVSGKSVDYASKVLRHGTKSLIAAVDEGRMAVSTAAIHAADPPDEQDRVTSQPKRKRSYVSISEAAASAKQNGKPESPEGESRGVGVRYANEAIDRLKKIPKNDGLRKRGFQIVSDWIRQNK